MSYKMKAIIFSLIPLLVITIIAYWDTPRGGHLAGLGFMMLMCMAVSVEFVILLIISAVVRGYFSSSDISSDTELKKAKSKAVLLAAGIVVLVGGSLCFGGAALL